MSTTRPHPPARVQVDVREDGSPSPAPFATPTLTRLYLEQGHHDEARRMARRLKAAGQGSTPLQVIDARLNREDERRQRVLQGLLAQVRANRR